MKIKSITLKDFRRFTNLKIQNIPQTAKLIIMAGPNGCGKSSVFDGLKSRYHFDKRSNYSWSSDYHNKYGSDTSQRISQLVNVEFHTLPTTLEEVAKSFYFRTAYRNESHFKLNNLSSVGAQVDEHRFDNMTQNDTVVARNYQRIVSQIIEEILVNYDGSLSVTEFREYILGDIKQSLSRIFPDLDLQALGKPLEDGTFRFKKGVSDQFEYQNLSGGEKAVFDLILDLVLKIKDFKNTIFCIDEPELHINSRIQGLLLEEMYNLIGDNSQLWLATHSIGMMRKAMDLEKDNPGTVVFLDFDNYNFDESIIIEPALISRSLWESMLNVAIADLAELITPSQIVICEGVVGKARPSDNVAHDAKCLNKIFSKEFPDTKFIAGGNCHEVKSDKHALIGTIEAMARGVKIIRVIDRDDRSQDEIDELNTNGIEVLTRRHLESYLFDDEVLDALCDKQGQAEKKEQLKLEKKMALATNKINGNPDDDVKSVSGTIYNVAKKLLNLSKPGNDAKEFMRSTLSPLLTSDMQVYKDLKQDIFKA